MQMPHFFKPAGRASPPLRHATIAVPHHAMPLQLATFGAPMNWQRLRQATDAPSPLGVVLSDAVARSSNSRLKAGALERR